MNPKLKDIAERIVALDGSYGDENITSEELKQWDSLMKECKEILKPLHGSHCPCDKD